MGNIIQNGRVNLHIVHYIENALEIIFLVSTLHLKCLSKFHGLMVLLDYINSQGWGENL